MAKFRGLRGKVARHALVDPALDLCGEIKDFDSHGGVLCNSGGPTAGPPQNPRDA